MAAQEAKTAAVVASKSVGRATSDDSLLRDDARSVSVPGRPSLLRPRDQGLPREHQACRQILEESTLTRGLLGGSSSAGVLGGVRPLALALGCSSDGDAFDEVAGDAAAATVVDLRGRGVGMAREILDLFNRHALTQEIGDYHDPETVRRDDLG